MINVFGRAGASRARAYAVAFARCYNAAIFKARVLLTPAERLQLERILSQLEAIGLLTLSRIAKGSRPLTFAMLLAELARYFRRDVVDAAVAAAENPATSTPHPSALIPLWDFEAEDESGDVLVATGHLFGTDLLFEALRVTDPDLPEPVSAVRDRYARWRSAAGSAADLGTVRIPGWAGHYVVFASPHPLS